MVRLPDRRGAGRAYRSLRYAGLRYRCPCCGGRFRTLLRANRRERSRCPRCLAKERHRLMWLWLEHDATRLAAGRRLLHVSPDRPLEPGLRARLGRGYVMAGIQRGKGVDVMADLQRLPFGRAAFDALICSHVLEHVDDDRAALAEINRVVRPGGWALLLVPIHPRNPHTIEDASVTDPQARAALFGQADHVRFYGHDDYVARLEAAGFAVAVERFAETLTERERRTYALEPEPLYVCTRL